MRNNHIDHLPKGLGDLPIIQLDLSNNRLGNSTSSDWDWVDRSRIKSSLQSMNLSGNEVSFANYNRFIINRIFLAQKPNKKIKMLIFTLFFKLTYFPYKLVKLRKLMMLTLKENRLTRIPFAIRRLKSLRTLNVADNQIKSLPRIFTRLSLDTLDVSGAEMFSPPFHPHEPTAEPFHSNRNIFPQPASLWQIAAKIVMIKT